VEVFFSNRISRRKPEPAAYRYVLDELGWQPQNTLFIDDNSLNVQAAQALGCLGYCIARNQPELILRQLELSD
jgi:HAD superfamily hydrolase (TIGR01509 family)